MKGHNGVKWNRGKGNRGFGVRQATYLLEYRVSNSNLTQAWGVFVLLFCVVANQAPAVFQGPVRLVNKPALEDRTYCNSDQATHSPSI